MNLIGESVDAIRWVSKVTRAFAGVRPWTTVTLVLCIALGTVASVLAFFLPLKVILLAGSEGVPRYFSLFVDAADQTDWIIGLSAGAVGFYLLSLILDAAGKRLAEAGSAEVLQGANEIAVASKQREEAQGYYRRFCGITGNLVLVIISFIAIGFMSPMVLLVISCLLLLEFLFTAAVFRYGDALHPGPVQRMVGNNLGGYLAIIFSVNFLVGFFVMLVPMLMGQGANLLLAILTVILMRQSFSAATSIVVDVTALWRRRQDVEPMVFREHQIQKAELSVMKDLRELFGKELRESMLSQELTAAGLPTTGLDSAWRDSTIVGVYTFFVKLPEARQTGAPAHLQQQVFSKSQLHLLEHEEFLFENVDRKALYAPTVVARFEVGPFACQVCEYGTGRISDETEWKERNIALMTHMWSFEPPRYLVAAYNTSRPTLGGRLSPEFLKRLEVALDDSADRECYQSILDKLDRIRTVLRSIPVYIFNPDMGRNNVVHTESGTPQVVSWGRWAIEPIGAALSGSMDAETITQVLSEVRERRSISEDDLNSAHVRLAFESREFEKQVLGGKYLAAMRNLRRILENKLVRDAD